ncbi:smc3, partial [Symbiodinium sp. CCMP2456]
QEDLKARREAEEKTRKEQAATLAVRKAIQRVRTATPETYDDLRATLEETQANNLEAMGSMAEKVSEEATRALEE